MDEVNEQQMTGKLQCGSGAVSVDEGCQQLTAPISIIRVPGSGCGLLSVRNTHTILASPSENQQAKPSRLLTHLQSRVGYVPRPYHHTVDILSGTAGRAPLCKVASFDEPGCTAASYSAAARRGGPVAKGRATSRHLVPPRLGLPPEEVGEQEEEDEKEKLYQPALENIRLGGRPRVDPPDDADYASSYDSTADRAGDHGPALASAAVRPYVAHIHNGGALRVAGKVEPDQPEPLSATGASPAEAATPSDAEEEEAPLPMSMSLETQQPQLETLQQRIPEEQEQPQHPQQQDGSFEGQQNGIDDPSHPLGRRRLESPLAGVNSRPKRQRREPAALSSYVSSAWRTRRTLSTKKQKASRSVGNLEVANGSGYSLGGHQCMLLAPAPAPMPLVREHAGHHWAPGPSAMAVGNAVIRIAHRGGPTLLRERVPVGAPPSGWAPPRRKIHGGSCSGRQDFVRSCPRQQRYRRMSDLLLLPEVKLPAWKHCRSSGDEESEGEENEDVCTDQADAAALTRVSGRDATTENGASANAEAQGRVTGASAAGSASPAARSMRDASGVARELAAAHTTRQRLHTAVVLKGTNQVKVSIPSAQVLFPDILPKVCSRAGKAVELYLAVPRAPTRAPRTQTQALYMDAGDDASADAGVGALRL
ncbi:hypothetical protein VaNZ11_011543 [Volvox africanus]|uniref:Uncharacterized protein n=1 Tax=Volvox africanus TaxID=51714 RepID=A0ABQ5SC55_9CHLO|nr:hypothetical protein VaNZ11_011543 [Volvox africanus]